GVRVSLVPGVQGGGGVVRREQHQRVEEREQQVLQRAREGRERRRRVVRLVRGLARGRGGRGAGVAEDDLLQVHAAAVVPVRRGRAHAPQRLGDELLLEGPVVVLL